MPEYRLLPDSPQDAFSKLRTKVQVFGGGFGNGKTAAAIVSKALRIAKEYPGANILIARATYPKLNDTIRKEFLKWCPASWIKSFPLSKNADNTCHLKNGTTINFRYIAQQGKGASEGEQTTSNLLSATYDLIIVDQLEDPEIVEKDFDDLLGRLRGNAKYIGDDSTMPTTGPRWLVVMVNPTRNWVYRRLIAPLKKYEQHGIIDDQLLVKRHPRDLPNGEPNPNVDKPILDANGKPELLISLVEGSTYTNKHNLGEDFLQTLEASYKGQQRDRYLYGEWASYEGLVYPEFNEVAHCMPQSDMLDILQRIVNRGFDVNYLEGYDFGLAVESCYLAGFVDQFNNVFICDGFYEPEERMRLVDQQSRIADIRDRLLIPPTNKVIADPAIFKRTSVTKDRKAKTIAELFNEGQNPVPMRRGDNSILSGIVKVNQYLAVSRFHRHPLTNLMGAPHLYIASELTFVHSEFTSYYWKKNSQGAKIDEPVDKNDHAMDVIKYILSRRPELVKRKPQQEEQLYLTHWQERPDSVQTASKRHRYG